MRRRHAFVPSASLLDAVALRPARAVLRRLRRAARPSDARTGLRPCWQSILPLTPPLCDRCGDPLPSWRDVSVPLARCARVPPRRPRRRPRARDRRLRRRAARDRARAEVRRPAIAGAAAGRADARARRRHARRRRLRGAGAAPPVAAARARLQSGGRSGAAPRPAGACSALRRVRADRHAGRACPPPGGTATSATRSRSTRLRRPSGWQGGSSCWSTM